MRSILNISLPEERKNWIRNRAKKANKSVSAYILYAISLEENLISEEELLQMSSQAEKDYLKGNTKELLSLAELMD